MLHKTERSVSPWLATPAPHDATLNWHEMLQHCIKRLVMRVASFGRAVAAAARVKHPSVSKLQRLTGELGMGVALRLHVGGGHGQFDVSMTWASTNDMTTWLTRANEAWIPVCEFRYRSYSVADDDRPINLRQELLRSLIALTCHTEVRFSMRYREQREICRNI